MIHWKNKPLNQLSKIEMQDALAESVALSIKTDRFVDNSQLYSAFVLGIVLGALVSTAGIAISSAI